MSRPEGHGGGESRFLAVKTSSPSLFVPTFSPSKQVLGFFGWVLLAFLAAAVGSVASVNAQGFYGQLSLPEWAPPAWIFGPVWSVLYFLMGVAAWLVWRRGGFGKSGMALELFVVQLAANAIWSWLFFMWRLGAWASVEILILWMLVLGTTISFWRVRASAGLLMLPYLAWLTFATALCFVTWRMNPALLGE